MTRGGAEADWRRDPKVWLAIGAALLFWSSAFAAIRAALGVHGVEGPSDGYGPGQIALGRFLVASLVVAAWARFAKIRLPERADVARIALAGFSGVTIYHVALNFGELTVSAGAASLIISASPVFTAVLSSLYLNERLTGWGWLGVLVSFVGVALISFGEGGGFGFERGAFLVLVAAFTTSLYFIASKPLLSKYSPLEFTAYTIWFGTLPMLVFAPGLVQQVPMVEPALTLTVVYLGILPGAVAYGIWAYALSRMPASALSSFLYAQPVFAVLIAWIWLGEVPGALAALGGAISLGGVLLTNIDRAR